MHLFSKENIWSNPHSCNNNSVDRIISKEEEREDPRRDSSIYLRVQNRVVFPQIIHILQDFFEYSVFYSVSTRNPATPSNSTYRINSSTRDTTTTRLIPCRLLPVTVPRVSKHSTRQNKAPGLPYSIPGPYSTSRLPVNSTRQKQHSKRQPASTHSLQQFPGQFYITEFYQEKIGFFQKG